MAGFEKFERGPTLGKEARLLPAKVYNSARLLLSHKDQNCVFVPIRSLQYMAVIDAEEIIFVNSHSRRFIDFSWREFKPQARDTLVQAVPYQFTYYTHAAPEILDQAQTEFSKFVHLMTLRWQHKVLLESADILPFDK